MANGLTDEQKKRREEIVEKLRRATLTEPVRFGLHPIADPDGVWALMKAIEELQKRFPSILTVSVPIVFVAQQGKFEGLDGWEHLANGTYLFDCGGEGPFNHHPHEAFPSPICAAYQVAVAFGLDQKREYDAILRRLHNSDTKIGGEFTVVKEYFRMSAIDSIEKLEKAILWFSEYLELFMAKQEEFHSEQLADELDKWGRFWKIRTRQGDVPVVTVESDLEDIHRLARHKTVPKSLSVGVPPRTSRFSPTRRMGHTRSGCISIRPRRFCVCSSSGRPEWPSPKRLGRS
jgi:hypothetical protein